jgi:hypothetical protein
MTHEFLVQRAAHYLRKSLGCCVVIDRPMGATVTEHPDAIGFMAGGRSYLIECKASRSDFLADRKKPHRILQGMGQKRWFLAPPGLIQLVEVPDGWGLLECHAKTIREVKKAPWRTHIACREEKALLIWWNRGRGESPSPLPLGPDQENTALDEVATNPHNLPQSHTGDLRAGQSLAPAEGAHREEPNQEEGQ